MFPTPMFNRVVVRPFEEPSVSKGGIHIPDTAKKKVTCGEVIAVGPGKVANLNSEPPTKLPHMTVEAFETTCKVAMDVRIPMTIKVGDTVHYSEYAGQIMRVNDQDFIVLVEDDILAFEREPRKEKK